MKISFYNSVKRLSDIGERELVRNIIDVLKNGNKIVDIGDDCAVLEFLDQFLLVSTDMISEKTHVPEKMNPWQIGWFVVAINLSDIAAKGGKPIGILLSLGLPRDTDKVFFDEIVKGAKSCAVNYNTSIIGGDTKENLNITICGTALGIVNKNSFMGRRGAKPGDFVAVTGTLGSAGAGYYALEHELGEYEIIKKLLEPCPRVLEGMTLANEKVVTCCMDISDGLSSSLYQLMELNDVGFEIDKDQIPVSYELLKLNDYDSNLKTFEYVLHFGGDYELLLTVDPKNFDRAKSCLENVENKLTKIGIVKERNEILLVHNGVKKVLSNRGYEHFR